MYTHVCAELATFCMHRQHMNKYGYLMRMLIAAPCYHTCGFVDSTVLDNHMYTCLVNCTHACTIEDDITANTQAHIG